MKALIVVLLATIAAASAVLAASPRDDFDCKMRAFALEYAQYLQPWRSPDSFSELADALDGTPEKAAGCSVKFTPTAEQINRKAKAGKAARFKQEEIRVAEKGGVTIYVDPVNGNDNNSGDQTSPFKTIEHALDVTRQTPGWDTIVLRQGTFYQSDTLVLTPQDSGLTIQAFPGEEVWLSGAMPLSGMQWVPYNTTPTWIVQQNQNAVYGGSASQWPFSVNGTYSTYQQCEAMCQANYTAGGSCRVWTWHDAAATGYSYQCWFRLDGVYSPTSEADHVSGTLRVQNIWKADMSKFQLSSIPALRFNGQRLIRARYPNANPETDGFMPPAVFRASWTPQSAPRAPDVQVDLPASALYRNTSVSMFKTFTAGIGGTCDRFQPNAGYWCSNNVQGGGSVIYYVPTAMQANQTILPNMPYKNATGAIVQTWRPGHWASWMYEVGNVTYDSVSGSADFVFSRGGFQGSRGEDTGEDTYIENVFEELDSPAEWFYDQASQTLYLFHNDTPGAMPPSDGSIQVTLTRHLFNITGTQAAPVTDISLVGFGLRDTRYTYMDPHGIPSGGDWTLERSAVVFLEGTERVTVSGCVFERVDGNAVLLSAYNRNASIVHNEFAWIGATAVALWGNTDGGNTTLPAGFGYSGEAGNFPRFNTIGWNLCRELGIWEKQSSFYTQFKSGENHIVQNIVFNGPRAHLNHNDGFWGGAVHERNLILNSCRESGDHGPFNSWDRDPYWLLDDTGARTTVKRMDEIRYNFIIANYNSLGAIDNDDGSSYYHTHHNFFVYGGGGLKNDFEGHDNWWHDNLVAWIDSYALHNGYGGTVGQPGNGYLNDHVDKFYNNTVILPKDGTYALPICSGQGKTIMANNTLYSPTGAISECNMPLAKWQAQGNDLGTVAIAYPPTLADDTIGWARALLLN